MDVDAKFSMEKYIWYATMTVWEEISFLLLFLKFLSLECISIVQIRLLKRSLGLTFNVYNRNSFWNSDHFWINCCQNFQPANVDYKNGTWWSMSTDENNKRPLLVLCFDMSKKGVLNIKQ